MFLAGEIESEKTSSNPFPRNDRDRRAQQYRKLNELLVYGDTHYVANCVHKGALKERNRIIDCEFNS